MARKPIHTRSGNRLLVWPNDGTMTPSSRHQAVPIRYTLVPLQPPSSHRSLPTGRVLHTSFRTHLIGDVVHREQVAPSCFLVHKTMQGGARVVAARRAGARGGDGAEVGGELAAL